MTTLVDESTEGPIVAGPGRYYRNTRYIMFVVLLAMGAWFGYDGFVGWPQMNRQHADIEQKRVEAANRNDTLSATQLMEQEDQYKHHTDLDIALQKVLCAALPIAGLLLLIRALYNSRGELRLEHDILHFPSHPPVPISKLTSVDRRLWDRKGIAYVNYALDDQTTGRLRLDDFVYDRPPTDKIFERIEKQISPTA